VDVQPYIRLHLRPHWEKIGDDLNDLNTQYKTRFKRARKKLGTIQCKELSLLEIDENRKRLYALYKSVSNNASFNTFLLPENHFHSMRLELGQDFRVFGYFWKDELIGFYTLILNGNQLETYFLGYDQIHQYDNQLYLNMLYDMIEFGVDYQFKTIVYARTAMEIKSSVGARPKAMSMYIKHTNVVVNALLHPLFRLMNPPKDWEERHPFKTNQSNKRQSSSFT